MLSPEERDAMRSEAADAKRRDILRAMRRPSREAVKPASLLAFLNDASLLLHGRASRPRPRHGAGTRYLL